MRNKRGITLIALVLTIIVMSILAGVSFNALVGDNGILTSAADSKMKYAEEYTKEQLEMAWSARMSKYLENITNPPVFIDEKELALFMQQLNAELDGNGTIEAITWDSSKNQYLILFKDKSGILFYTAITPAGKITDIAAQGNKKKNIEPEKFAISNYAVNIDNIDNVDMNTPDEEVSNSTIYAYLYGNEIDDYILVFNNINEGINDTNYNQLIDSWNSSEDNFNFSHTATPERIARESRRRWSRCNRICFMERIC